MELNAPNRKDQRELPERYTPLVECVSSETGGPNVAFESAFRRIEGRRLIAEQNLRRALQGFWSMNREDLNALRPFDLLHCFQEYAETRFKAAGEECLPLFQDLERYRSFLHVVQDWVLEAIFPKPETFEQSIARLAALEGGIRALVEHARASGLWDDAAALQVDALIDDLGGASIQTPDEPEFERLFELILQQRIIGLRETFSAFEERCRESSEGLFSWGGDWEHLLDESLADVLRTGSDSLGASATGSAFREALRKAENREEAKEFWTVALEQLHAPLLAAWWNMSADASARGTNTEGIGAEAETDRRAPTPATAGSDSAREGIGPKLDSPSCPSDTVRPRRTPNLDTSRERLALVNALARELATIKQELVVYCTAEGLKQKHPEFILWKHIDEVELKELADGTAFTPKAYAETLTLRKFGITSRETLKKDRSKLRKAQRNQPRPPSS